MSHFRRILHATDFSPASRRAFRHAVALARESRARLLIVHVYSAVLPLGGEGYASPGVYDRWMADIQRDAQRRLDRVVADARRRGARVQSLLLQGLTHERIVRAARSTRADLIVLGTHGRTGLGRMFLGSVAAKVVTLAPCPVLTVGAR